jgi:hypothetical protein
MTFLMNLALVLASVVSLMLVLVVLALPAHFRMETH